MNEGLNAALTSVIALEGFRVCLECKLAPECNGLGKLESILVEGDLRLAIEGVCTL